MACVGGVRRKSQKPHPAKRRRNGAPGTAESHAPSDSCARIESLAVPRSPAKAKNADSQKQVSKATLKLRLLKRLKCTLKYEKQAWLAGAKLVAGIDEVGRGSLFGPVVAAAVILDPAYRIRGLRDSKLLDRGGFRVVRNCRFHLQKRMS